MGFTIPKNLVKKAPASAPKPKAKPVQAESDVTVDDLKDLAASTLTAQREVLTETMFIAYVRELFDQCTEIMAAANQKETQSGPRQEVEDVDAQSLIEGLDSETEKLEHLSRIQLVAVAQCLGEHPSGTKGKPVKDLREIVKSRLEARATEEGPSTTSTPVKRPSGVVKFRVPRRTLA